MEQLTLDPRAWSNLPTPKIRPGDRIGVYGWSKFYSAFSERFALAALRLLGPCEDGVVLDPFCGIGTSLIASAKLGYPSIGIDLDPFSALLARAAFATEASPAAVRKILAARVVASSDVFPEPDHAPAETFAIEDWRYASAVFEAVFGKNHSESRAAWHQLLHEPTSTSDSEVIALAALGLAADHVANLARGSNPVWHRRSVPGERAPSSPLSAEALEAAEILLTDLSAQKKNLLTRDATILNADFQDSTAPTRPIDLVVTSPPYLNRLDYVVNHLAPLSLLSLRLPIDLDDLRKQMLGTTKIVTKTGTPETAWGSRAIEALDRIRNHPSKASDTYYYWIYFDYFQRLFSCFRRLSHLLHSRSLVLTVIQNSFYKELEIPVPEILLEMATSLNLIGTVVRSQNVRAHLGTLSPQQVAYVPSKVLREDVLLFHPSN